MGSFLDLKSFLSKLGQKNCLFWPKTELVNKLQVTILQLELSNLKSRSNGIIARFEKLFGRIRPKLAKLGQKNSEIQKMLTNSLNMIVRGLDC